ncbi:MAG: Gfo/Idh/MocA family protein [Pirellulaceae bacterium]
MARTIRVGMLGYGFMGRCHTNAFRTVDYMYPSMGVRTQLVSMCGRNETLVRRRALEYGFERSCTDWHEIVNDPTIDLFDNCGPDPAHVEPTIAALQAGKHVICEKPLSVSLTDARRMRDAARESGRLAMCMFNYRFFPAVSLARQLIRSGRLGAMRHMRISYLQMAGHDPALRPEQVWYSAWPHSGVLQGIGSHAIDQCRFLVGEITSVSALVRTFHKDRALATIGGGGAVADEGTAALLEFQCGAIGVLEASAVAFGPKNRLLWEINGSRGSARWNLEQPNSLWLCLQDEGGGGFAEVSVTEQDHPYVGAWWPPGHTLGWEHGHIIGVAQFLRSLAEGGPLPFDVPTFDDGYRVAEIIETLRQSSVTGHRMPTTPE